MLMKSSMCRVLCAHTLWSTGLWESPPAAGGTCLYCAGEASLEGAEDSARPAVQVWPQGSCVSTSGYWHPESKQLLPDPDPRLLLEKEEHPDPLSSSREIAEGPASGLVPAHKARLPTPSFHTFFHGDIPQQPPPIPWSSCALSPGPVWPVLCPAPILGSPLGN